LAKVESVVSVRTVSIQKAESSAKHDRCGHNGETPKEDIPSRDPGSSKDTASLLPLSGDSDDSPGLG